MVGAGGKARKPRRLTVSSRGFRPLWTIRKPRDQNNNLASSGYPLTNDAQSIPNFAHRRWVLGACLIAGFVGTSTGRGTRRRGKPERSGDQGEPVRLSDPASGRGLRTRTDDAAGPRLPNDEGFGPTAFTENQAGIDGRRTAKAARNAEDQEPSGYSRPRTGFAPPAPRPRSRPSKAKSNPDLARGRKQRFDRAGVPSLNSGARFRASGASAFLPPRRTLNQGA